MDLAYINKSVEIRTGNVKTDASRWNQLLLFNGEHKYDKIYLIF